MKHKTQKNDLNLKLLRTGELCICIDNGSSNNLSCYPPDSHQSHNAVYWRTGGEGGLYHRLRSYDIEMRLM